MVRPVIAIAHSLVPIFVLISLMMLLISNLNNQETEAGEF